MTQALSINNYALLEDEQSLMFQQRSVNLAGDTLPAWKPIRGFSYETYY